LIILSSLVVEVVAQLLVEVVVLVGSEQEQVLL
jgi:hypothetical protein